VVWVWYGLGCRVIILIVSDSKLADCMHGWVTYLDCCCLFDQWLAMFVSFCVSAMAHCFALLFSACESWFLCYVLPRLV
jgi:hypothetical protein